ncbi:hypothetical protein BGX38DRAFT_1200388 [Terfezia claveryi]|nr:hypothetical protein BGX38DRAFT_1200388 [Terfezia claveryi]
MLRGLSGWLGLLMSGLLVLMLTIGILSAIAWLFNPGIYNITWRFLRWVGNTALQEKIRQNKYRRRNSVVREEEEALVTSSSSVSEKSDRGCSFMGLTWGRVYVLASVITEIILLAVKPSSLYTHMSGTLPFTIFEGLWTARSEFCEPIPWDEGVVL